MSWRTNKAVLLARNVGRTLGLNSRIATWMNGSGYEARYDERFSQALCFGDVVWDVGANVGYYTQLFSRRVGAGGKVIAFEPSPHNFKRLTSATQEVSNVFRVPAALGRENGTLGFEQGADDLGATSRIIHEGKGNLLVEVKRGADLIESGAFPGPSAIKIDVEGFELEVLQGLGTHLVAPSLHTVGIEVHFTILRERGTPNAPHEIEAMLVRSGFKVGWPDASHIIATRQR